MASSITLRVALLALVTATPACFPSTVPWPPPAGSCIEATYHRTGRSGDWRYRLAGEPRTRKQIERELVTVPGGAADVGLSRRRNAIAVVGIVGILPIAPTILASAAFATALPLFPALPLFAIGVITVMDQYRIDDPFYRAVLAYNARARELGRCKRRED